MATESTTRPDPAAETGIEALPKAYGPVEVEDATYQRWLDADVFRPEGRGSRADWSKPPFVIVQPPPNVTGALHTGHALTSTVEDMLVRRARMQRRPTLWLPGVDHASIAAQVVLDRVIADDGETRESLGRERYLERMWRFVDETRGVITGQHRRLGVSVDWSRERFTMDDVSARAVRVSFKRIYDAGLAYRGERLINWCPRCRTSLSDLEVIATPETGRLWSIRYHFLRDDGTPEPDGIVVATTRPETLLGDTAVAVHPDDDRYRALVGRRVLIPFVERPVPIIADAVVRTEFGTGAVKITPAHDTDDFETGRRHGLPIVDVMDDGATMNAAAGPYAGLTREEARRRIVADLEARGDLVESKAHEMILGRCQRSDDIVEPRLKTQWFINVKPMAELAMSAVREGRTRFVPTRFEKTFFDWLENIRDWNVSRQLWWGHRIPAWYCPDGHITVSDREDGPDGCAACGRPAAELRQDEDIFDTWYSSGLWPLTTLGWPDDTDDLRRFYPGTVMETGYDIIFFWVARMMMLDEWLTGREPFATVYLHGMVRDPYGQKMSKTRGNVVDPLGVIEELGADSLRFALIHGSAPGADQRLGSDRLEAGRNFANKLWNAGRFVLGARPPELADDAPLALPAAELMGPAEQWIVRRCAATIEAVDRAHDAFQLGEATRVLYEAVWGEYCDWYLEFAKAQLADAHADVERRTATWQVLAWVLDRYLRLLHPLMPFITEELWRRLPRDSDDDSSLLVSADWPAGEAAGVGASSVAARAVASEQAERGVAALIELVRAIRNARAEARVDPSTWLEATLYLRDEAALAVYDGVAGPLGRLARVRATVAPSESQEPAAAAHGAATLMATAGRSEVRLSHVGADSERERSRIERELAEARDLLAQAEARLANRQFVERAPAAVVDGTRARAADLREHVDRLAQRLSG